MIRNLILAIYTFVLFLLLSVPVLAQSTSSDNYDDRMDIGNKSQPYSPPTTGAEIQHNPALVNPASPSGVKKLPSAINPSSPDGINPLNPAGFDQSSPTGGTGGSTGY